jgi:hypothetical protein
MGRGLLAYNFNLYLVSNHSVPPFNHSIITFFQIIMLRYETIFYNVEHCFLLSKCQTYRSGSICKRPTTRNLRVALAIAPMRTGGMAIMIQPKAATYDSTWALPAVLLDNTLWKYTCKNRQVHWCTQVQMQPTAVIPPTWIRLLVLVNLSNLRFS